MKKFNVVYQGVQGAFSEEALIAFSKQHKLPLQGLSSHGFFQGQFSDIETKTKLGWVPIENSYHGTVVEPIDLFREYDFEILATYTHRVNHALCVAPGKTIKSIKKVISHPQALGQCSKFLHEHKLQQERFDDTAAAAQHVAENPDAGYAAICSERAAEIYGLKVLKKAVQDDPQNRTRFLLVKKRTAKFPFEKKLQASKTYITTTVLFETRDLPAALYKCLGGFATNAINLTKIESRPVKKGNGTSFFYLDFDGHPDDPLVKNALDELAHFAKEVKVLGSY